MNGAGTGLPDWEAAFLRKEALPASYSDSAGRWFAPLAELLLARRGDRGDVAPLLVGVNGSQGSGKSTLCAWLVAALQARHGLGCVALSLDDFYYTKAERQQLAASVHPLLATRGVPGTHDMELLAETVRALGSSAAASVRIPRFDKARDDRRPESDWDAVDAPIDIILLEGWCVGVGPAADTGPALNRLETERDADGRWRAYVDAELKRSFVPFYASVDLWVMLKAPSFECVYAWRLEQEHKLAARRAGSGVMSDEAIAEFIQYYERLTRRCLDTLPATMDVVYELDADRAIVAAAGREASRAFD